MRLYVVFYGSLAYKLLFELDTLFFFFFPMITPIIALVCTRICINFYCYDTSVNVTPSVLEDYKYFITNINDLSYYGYVILIFKKSDALLKVQGEDQVLNE